LGIIGVRNEREVFMPSEAPDAYPKHWKKLKDDFKVAVKKEIKGWGKAIGKEAVAWGDAALGKKPKRKW
jgi:hypothetical protein